MKHKMAKNLKAKRQKVKKTKSKKDNKLKRQTEENSIAMKLKSKLTQECRLWVQYFLRHLHNVSSKAMTLIGNTINAWSQNKNKDPEKWMSYVAHQSFQCLYGYDISWGLINLNHKQALWPPFKEIWDGESMGRKNE